MWIVSADPAVDCRFLTPRGAGKERHRSGASAGLAGQPGEAVTRTWWSS